MKCHSLINFLMAVANALCLPTVYAGPMGYKDSVMSMGDFGPNWRETFANYALTPRDGVGAGALWMKSDDGSKTRQVADINFTRLLSRWNLPNAQANVWLQAGLGTVQGNDFSGNRLLVSPGVQVDYETTRIYASANARLYRAKNINHDYVSLRAGFSFYEVDYDEVQPWFIVEARRMRGLSGKTEITPMLRLIHSRYFIEAGLNNAKQARFNFMYIF